VREAQLTTRLLPLGRLLDWNCSCNCCTVSGITNQHMKCIFTKIFFMKIHCSGITIKLIIYHLQAV